MNKMSIRKSDKAIKSINQFSSQNICSSVINMSSGESDEEEAVNQQNDSVKAKHK